MLVDLVVTQWWQLSPFANRMRVYYWRLFGTRGRMDAEQEKLLWQTAADQILDVVDDLYLSGKVTAPVRYNFLKRLQSISNLGPEFRARNWQECLKKEITERRGTDSRVLQQVKALPFPDAKPVKKKLSLSIRKK